MRTLSFWKKSVYSGVVFFGTVVVLSVGYAVWNSTMSSVTSGSSLTAGGWNALVDNINDLNSRWSRVGNDIAFTGGNVGIGVSPSQKLSVAGTVESTSGGFKFPDGTIQTTSEPGDYIRATGGTSTYGNSSVLCQTEFGPQWRVCAYPEIAGYTKDISQKGIGNIIGWVACGRSDMLQSGAIKKIGISADAADSGTWTCPAVNGCNWEQHPVNGAFLHCTRAEDTQQKVYCCRNY